MAHLWLTVLLMLLATTTLEARVVEPTLLEMATTRTGHLMQATRVFEKGPYDVTTVTVRKSRPPAPPLPLLLVSPNTTGLFPVILFVHGMLLQNSDYSDLFKHIASHGYVIVAPQKKTLLAPMKWPVTSLAREPMQQCNGVRGR
uniref:Uncharacterized protein n=1 Tax=Opuntia streptacantha TaxID=393608 RepID=A0A7C8ZW80_OPUST